mgnify:CR=1 FL=1
MGVSADVATVEVFRGDYFFLSNFFAHPIGVGGMTFATAEHAFAAAKTDLPDEKRAIAAAPTPAEAKRLGREVTLRPDWDDIRLDVMREIVNIKFNDPTLAGQLLDTGDALLREGNDWGDRFWGVCADESENWLGRILMDKRRTLKSNQDQVSSDPGT